MPELHRQLLLVEALAHVDAVGDAVAVGDDQRGAIVGVGFEEGRRVCWSLAPIAMRAT